MVVLEDVIFKLPIKVTYNNTTIKKNHLHIILEDINLASFIKAISR